MKQFLLALAVALLFSATGHAQAPASHAKPLPKDNVVFVQTTDSALVALRKLGQAFMAQGYIVEKLDKDFLTIELRPKTLPTTFSPILLARAVATSGPSTLLKLSGEYRAIVLNRPINDQVEMKGSEKGIPTSGYRALEKVALTYPGGQVSYGKQ